MPGQNDIEGQFALARLRAERKVRFYKHLILFLPANFFMALADLVFWPGLVWFFWPLAGWGLVLGTHGLAVAYKNRPEKRPKRQLSESGAKRGEGK